MKHNIEDKKINRKAWVAIIGFIIVLVLFSMLEKGLGLGLQ